MPSFLVFFCFIVYMIIPDAPINIELINKAHKTCEANGGLKAIQPKALVTPYKAICNNNVKGDL